MLSLSLKFKFLLCLQWCVHIPGSILRHCSLYHHWLRVGEGFTQTDLEGLELGQSHRMESLLQTGHPRTVDGVL